MALKESGFCFAVILAVVGPIIGAAIGVALPLKPRWMRGMLAFSGGTMLAISFLELLPESIAVCGVPAAVVGLAIGLLTMMALGEAVHCFYPDVAAGNKDTLEKTSMLVVAALFLHELPEGIAMASGGVMKDPKAIFTIALAIAVHNIPEGICAAVPYYYATGKRWKAFFLSASTAIPALLGFWLGKAIFQQVNPRMMGMMIAAVAGLMIHITCQELLPTAQGEERGVGAMVALMAGIDFVMLLEMIQ